MNKEGSVVARVTLAGENIPVKDALVTVTSAEGDKNILIGTRKTDENGKTAPIVLETPDIEYSLAPEDEVKPFKSVDVRIDHPSSYTVVLRNVQVFSDNVSLVNVSLVPFEEGDTKKAERIIVITNQNL